MSGLLGHIELLMGAAGGGGATDPYWANVVALLHFDGTNGSQVFTDQKGHSFTTPGFTALSTAQFKFGLSSVFMAGTSGYYLSSPTSTDWEFGSGDWTIELFVYPAAAVVARQNLVIRYLANGIGFYIDATGVLRAFAQNTTSGLVTLPLGATTVTHANWHHVVFVRDGGTLRTYLDGVQQASAALSGAMNAISTDLYISSEAAGIRFFNGYMDELRITKGVCRYPGGTSFSPPTSPFPNS